MSAPEAADVAALSAVEYQQEQQQITSTFLRTLLYIIRPFRTTPLTNAQWPRLLKLIYPLVEEAREETADLARRFYDAERVRMIGTTSPAFLAEYRPSWFAEGMEPARRAFLKTGASDGAVTEMALRAQKEVENAGRRTMLNAVDSDQEVVGWARVATGRETCAFCMMLVSRGPVYLSAESAGLDLDDTSAAKMLSGSVSDAEYAAVARRWHAGCDCRVVPVYDRADWPGRDAYLRAEKIWKATTRGYHGQDAVNAFRRAVENGTLNPADYALAA